MLASRLCLNVEAIVELDGVWGSKGVGRTLCSCIVLLLSLAPIYGLWVMVSCLVPLRIFDLLLLGHLLTTFWSATDTQGTGCTVFSSSAANVAGYKAPLVSAKKYSASSRRKEKHPSTGGRQYSSLVKSCGRKRMIMIHPAHRKTDTPLPPTDSRRSQHAVTALFLLGRLRELCALAGGGI